MVLFDSEIKELLNLLDKYELKSLPITSDLLEDVGKNNMVFSNESAYELGGGMCDSVSFELSTSTDELVNSDEILLLGKDLNEINSDTEFSRITLVNVEDDKLKGDELYDRLERIKFTKYRVSPKGYMLRTASGNKEKVRVSKEIAKSSNFSRIGSAYIKAYKQMPFVKWVKIMFVTGNSDIYKPLKELGIRKTNITDAVDHILKGMVTNDCGACSVKELCDQVEGMREIHKGGN